jgi:hypothetical protein
VTTGGAARRQLGRAVAFAIAIGGIIDPAITSDRPAKRVVVVSAGDSARDGRLADAVANTLRRRFDVARTAIAGASAAVVVGDRLPPSDDNFPSPVFVVVADSNQPSVELDRIDLPSNATLDERVPVHARVSVHGAAGRSVDVTARAGGAVLDRVTRPGAGDSTFVVPLSFVPTSVGPLVIQVSASIGGAESPAVADAAINVISRRRSILFYDRRPSWMSTFVRRALERDPQFLVTSRVVTSRNVSTNAGQPPASLGDQSTLATFDAVVVGAPNTLSATDVGGLEAFMRRRGGSVVFLLDEATPGPYERLARNSSWSSTRGTPATFALTRDDSMTIRAGDVVVPTKIPTAATVVAGGATPVVWETPVGAGRLVVSGARDAWRFRDAGSSTFDRFWRSVIADAAASAPPPLMVDVPALAKPGETVDVRVTVRDAALAADAADAPPSIRATITALLEPDTRIRMWPQGDVGQFAGAVRAPRQPGVYRLTVAAAGRTAEVPFVIAADARTEAPVSRALSTAWATSRGGRLFHARDIDDLPSALDTAIQSRSERTTWHPFRSPWWIVPFVLALSVEWWLRRRQGMR